MDTELPLTGVPPTVASYPLAPFGEIVSVAPMPDLEHVKLVA